MLRVLIGLAILVGSAALWLAGLKLFLRSQLSRAGKVSWALFLFLAGIGIGVVLPLAQIWSRFLILIVGLPVLAVADVWLLRSRRDLSFWIRACGFEVCSVFGIAGSTRYLLDLAGVAAFAQQSG